MALTDCLVKQRITLEIDSKAQRAIAKLKKRTDSATTVEIFRRSLTIADLITEHLENGGSVILRTKDGREESLKLT